MKNPISWTRQMLKAFKAYRIKDPNVKEPVPVVTRKPEPNEISQKRPGYDQLTHTGQAWDEADYRRARFEIIAAKQVNPNIAAHLIAELPPVASEEHVVFCDGGHRHGGHPKVFINLDKPGTHACGYCGQRFFNTHYTKQKDLEKAHIQV